MLRSATLKLTLSYLLIIAIISLGFSAALYHVAMNDLAYGLQRQTQRISNDFPVFSGSRYLRSDAELAEGRLHIINGLVVFNISVLVLAGIASYALARRTLQPLEANHERQKRFTADVSHELRTPLTALTMESQVALLDPNLSKDELKKVIASNVEEAEKLSSLVSNLLKLSQLDVNSPVQGSSFVDIHDLVKRSIEQISSTAKIRHIAIASNLGPTVRIAGDITLLTQLLVILLDNAIKYSPANSTVHVSVNAQNNLVEISISDQGIGIPKDDLTHVFDRFYRADSARTKNDTSGFGLGLSIAKLIADSHGAAIHLTSRRGKGTTAQVLLPRRLEKRGAHRQTTGQN